MENKKEFRLLDTLNKLANNEKLDDVANEINERASKANEKLGFGKRGQFAISWDFKPETRDIVANGNPIIATEKQSLVSYLRPKLVLADAGATLLTNLNSQVSIPLMTSGASSTWAAENDPATNGSVSGFGELLLKPKRLTTYMDVSKSFLATDSTSAEDILIQDITASISEALEKTILGNIAGSDTQPAGIFYNKANNFSGAASWQGITALESALQDFHGLQGKLAYICSNKLAGTFKNTPKAGSYPVFIMSDDNTMNGYNTFKTSSIADNTISLANWSDLIIASFGAIDLTVDPYSRALNNQVRIVINSYFDAGFRRAQSYVYGLMA